MPNQDKYIQELETKLANYQEKEKQWEKEQGAQIKVFKGLEKEIKALKEQEKKGTHELEKKNQEIGEWKANHSKLETERKKEVKKVKELEQDNTKLYNELTQYHQESQRTLKELGNKLTSEQEKNKLLEEKILEAEKQAQNPLSPSPIEENEDEGYFSDDEAKWEQEKERLISQFEKTRNEQANEIIKLEKENTKLDKDLNKAVDELEERDKELERLEEKNDNYKEKTKELETKLNNMSKKGEVKNEQENINPTSSQKSYFFTCDICEQNKKSKLHLGKVNGLGIDPTKNNKICDFCINKVDLIRDTEQDYIWE